MSWITDLIELAAPVVLAAAQKMADSAVDGAEINADQKKALWNAHNLIATYGTDLVDSTANPYDDMTLKELKEFARDTLEEAGIQVPLVPAFG